MQHSHAAEDVRLLRVGDEDVWASYVLFNHPDPECVGGHWLAQLRMDVSQSRRGVRFQASLDGTEHASGTGLNLTTGTPLWSRRNGGLIVRDGRIAFE